MKGYIFGWHRKQVLIFFEKMPIENAAEKQDRLPI